ncbi:glycoside hydrolase family 3 C-terminal domain-containing protein [Streptomyces sp. NPDC127117]|uniref:glycoside hydrolase family 3 C-terminal domain-containing protein n=1 Tax=Streptomyces sp. NPDC127117 TaxID=3345368 RepID=UPI003627E39E
MWTRRPPPISASLRAAGRAAQQRSQVVLKNTDGLLPLPGRPRVYAEGIDPTVLARYAEVAATPAEADFAVLRLASPWQERDGVLGAYFHGGSLEFTAQQVDHVREVSATVPTALLVHLERPAVLAPLDAEVPAIVVDFGSDDDALLSTVFGRTVPRGTLPFDLPSSAAAVAESREDVPFDTADPLYRFGHGLRL